MIFRNMNSENLTYNDREEEMDMHFIQKLCVTNSFNSHNMNSNNNSLMNFSKVNQGVNVQENFASFNQCFKQLEYVNAFSLVFTPIISKKASELFD